MAEQKKGHRFSKAVATVVLLGAVAAAGDQFNLVSRVTDPIRYFRRPAAEGFYKDYRNLEKRIVVNDGGQVETYIGNKVTGEYLAVRENMHAGRTFADEVTDIVEYAKKEYRKLEVKVKDLINRVIMHLNGEEYEID